MRSRSRHRHGSAIRMTDATISLLKDLIAIDSVNPSLVPGGAGESAIAQRVAVELRSIGAEQIARTMACNAAIVCEPTDLAVGVGHKGFEWVEVETHGVAAHGSRPDDGVDAILMMGRVLAGLESLEQRFIEGRRHALL